MTFQYDLVNQSSHWSRRIDLHPGTRHARSAACSLISTLPRYDPSQPVICSGNHTHRSCRHAPSAASALMFRVCCGGLESYDKSNFNPVSCLQQGPVTGRLGYVRLHMYMCGRVVQSRLHPRTQTLCQGVCQSHFLFFHSTASGKHKIRTLKY
jgi:hypothetical protein